MKFLRFLWRAYNWPFDALFDRIPETWTKRDYKILFWGSLLAAALIIALSAVAPQFWVLTTLGNIACGSISGRASFLGWEKD